MITLHRLNKQEFVLNADLIETIESTPDTLMTLVNGKKFMVRDGIGDIIDKVIAFRRSCNGSIRVVHDETSGTAPADEDAGPDGGNAGNQTSKAGMRGTGT